jgi:excisionase family DNA binding protein
VRPSEQERRSTIDKRRCTEKRRVQYQNQDRERNEVVGVRTTAIQIPEIAKRLGIGRLKVYAMLEAGIIPGIRFGRKWIVTRYAYEQWERTCGMQTAPTLMVQ